jgi:hypothetical protein
MGGYEVVEEEFYGYTVFFNDVWKSSDGGSTWIALTTAAWNEGWLSSIFFF